ncbi:MAG: cupin domain-containing protein [Methylovulum sp.]|uniref:cupin domain-containing protein n=1 Tax=Methylovulum sp. TaxID=1916980 RepID=UPI00260DAD60|nr:cupin domain-containing protein [Methylovulum sp.]MDD2724611.1 cupin domain-containing protein [Methylovulum sp.]MDD5123362.1 cupin domain-containing protein [Methylovulum sp.]
MTSKTDPSETTESTLEQAELARLLTGHIAPLMPDARIQQSLSARLQERVARSVIEHSRLLTVRAKNGVWQTLKKGVRFKMLWQGDQGNSVLIDFAPGAALPVHRHNWLEEGIVLRGGLQMGGLELDLYDYHVSPPNSRHESIRSRQGALAYLRGTSLGHAPAVTRELLGGLLPFGGNLGESVFAHDDGDWHPIADGVSRKILHTDGTLSSSMFRLEPGSSVGLHAHTQHEECMMLSGELFLGDILLQAGDYQLAPAGTLHGEAFSDVGALLFVRGSAD